jgi:molybdopterin molybdotransferase
VKPLTQHLADLAGLVPLRPAQRVGLEEAHGLVLAQDVYSRGPLPPFASSAMDGYAVRVSDVPARLTVVGDVPAGSVPTAVVGPGTAVRVMTGSLLPEGTEAVVPVEHTDGGMGHVVVTELAVGGAYLRPAGSDVAAGALVLSAGSVLTASRIAVLASVGEVTPLVHPRPRVLVISTGDELVDAGAEPGPAQLVDSNRPALIAAVTEAGAEAIDGGRCSDSPESLLAMLTATPADLVVTTGGVSMGAYDVVKATLLPLGTVTFERIAMQPGMPQAWGHLPGGTPLLGLPGNPVSALVSWELFGRAALGRPRPQLRAQLAEAVTGSPKDKTQLLRMTVVDGVAHPGGGTGSHLLVALGHANALVVVPEGQTELAADSWVTVIPLEGC